MGSAFTFQFKMAKSEAVIVAAARTPIGALNGSLASIPPHELGSTVIKSLLNSTNVETDQVSEVILGQVLTCGQGQNPARQAAINAGLPHSICAYGLNMVCGSGLKAVTLAAQAIEAEDDKIIVAGGQESMSQAVHFLHLRNGIKFGDATMKDSMVIDGLTDAFDKCHMGITAENVAKEFNISRSEQDAFAAESQKKTKSALEQDEFDQEIVPVEVKSRKGTVVVSKDEHPKPETNEEGLARLRPT